MTHFSSAKFVGCVFCRLRIFEPRTPLSNKAPFQAFPIAFNRFEYNMALECYAGAQVAVIKRTACMSMSGLRLLESIEAPRRKIPGRRRSAPRQVKPVHDFVNRGPRSRFSNRGQRHAVSLNTMLRYFAWMLSTAEHWEIESRHILPLYLWSFIYTFAASPPIGNHFLVVNHGVD